MVPSSMFAFPMYDETVDAALVLGSFGFVVAHELGHGFDPKGSIFGPDGTVTGLWHGSDSVSFQVG